MPALKRHLGEREPGWANPKGALDKQGEKETEVSKGTSSPALLRSRRC